MTDINSKRSAGGKAFAKRRKDGEGLIQLNMMFTLDPERRTIAANGITVDLTPQEYVIAASIAAGRGRPVTNEAIIPRVWNGDCEPEWATGQIRVRLSTIRSKIRAAKLPVPIGTLWDVGYVFSAPVHILDSVSVTMTAAVMRTLRQLVSTHHDRRSAAVVAEWLA